MPQSNAVDLAQQIRQVQEDVAALSRKVQHLREAYNGLPVKDLGETDSEVYREVLASLEEADEQGLAAVSTALKGAQWCADYLSTDPAARPADPWDGFDDI